MALCYTVSLLWMFHINISLQPTFPLFSGFHCSVRRGKISTSRQATSRDLLAYNEGGGARVRSISRITDVRGGT